MVWFSTSGRLAKAPNTWDLSFVEGKGPGGSFGALGPHQDDKIDQLNAERQRMCLVRWNMGFPNSGYSSSIV